MKNLCFVYNKTTIMLFREFKRVIYPNSGSKIGVFNKVTKFSIEIILN